MILNVGDILEIRGEEVIVCFSNVYNNEKYICVANSSDKFNIYKYKIEDKKLMIADVINKKELNEVLKIFLKEAMDNHGNTKEIEDIFKQFDNLKNNYSSLSNKVEEQ